MAVHSHGASGYRAGCRCGVCTEGQRARKEAYRARKAGECAIAAVPSPRKPNAHAAVAAETVGTLERLTKDLIDAWAIRGEEGELVAAQALAAAKVFDQALALGRPHLMSPAHRVLNDCLDRLQRLGARQPTAPNDDVDPFLASLTPLGDPTLIRRPKS